MSNPSHVGLSLVGFTGSSSHFSDWLASCTHTSLLQPFSCWSRTFLSSLFWWLISFHVSLTLQLASHALSSLHFSITCFTYVTHFCNIFAVLISHTPAPLSPSLSLLSHTPSSLSTACSTNALSPPSLSFFLSFSHSLFKRIMMFPLIYLPLAGFTHCRLHTLLLSLYPTGLTHSYSA